MEAGLFIKEGDDEYVVGVSFYAGRSLYYFGYTSYNVYGMDFHCSEITVCLRRNIQFYCPSSGIHFYKASHSFFGIFIKFLFILKYLSLALLVLYNSYRWLFDRNISYRPCTVGSTATNQSAGSDSR